MFLLHFVKEKKLLVSSPGLCIDSSYSNQRNEFSLLEMIMFGKSGICQLVLHLLSNVQRPWLRWPLGFI